MYCRVWVFFRKIVKPFVYISKSKNCSISLSNLSTVNLDFCRTHWMLLTLCQYLSVWLVITCHLHNDYRTLFFPLSSERGNNNNIPLFVAIYITSIELYCSLFLVKEGTIIISLFLVKKGTIKFYIPYVDDMSLLVKR